MCRKAIFRLPASRRANPQTSLIHTQSWAPRTGDTLPASPACVRVLGRQKWEKRQTVGWNNNTHRRVDDFENKLRFRLDSEWHRPQKNSPSFHEIKTVTGGDVSLENCSRGSALFYRTERAAPPTAARYAQTAVQISSPMSVPDSALFLLPTRIFTFPSSVTPW